MRKPISDQTFSLLWKEHGSHRTYRAIHGHLEKCGTGAGGGRVWGGTRRDQVTGTGDGGGFLNLGKAVYDETASGSHPWL